MKKNLGKEADAVVLGCNSNITQGEITVGYSLL
jgi:hypothetical protein